MTWTLSPAEQRLVLTALQNEAGSRHELARLTTRPDLAAQHRGRAEELYVLALRLEMSSIAETEETH